MSFENTSEQSPLKSVSPVSSINEVDESWALKLINECEQEDIPILVQSAPEHASAIEHQMMDYAKKSETTQAKTDAKSKTVYLFKKTVKKILPAFDKV
jgi:hypothetical protein